jgi:hypothetical protein
LRSIDGAATCGSRCLVGERFRTFAQRLSTVEVAPIPAIRGERYRTNWLLWRNRGRSAGPLGLAGAVGEALDSVLSEQLLSGARQVSAAITVIKDSPLARDAVICGELHGPRSPVLFAKVLGSRQDHRVVWFWHLSRSMLPPSGWGRWDREAGHARTASCESSARNTPFSWLAPYVVSRKRPPGRMPVTGRTRKRGQRHEKFIPEMLWDIFDRQKSRNPFGFSLAAPL